MREIDERKKQINNVPTDTKASDKAPPPAPSPAAVPSMSAIGTSKPIATNCGAKAWVDVIGQVRKRGSSAAAVVVGSAFGAARCIIVTRVVSVAVVAAAKMLFVVGE